MLISWQKQQKIDLMGVLGDADDVLLVDVKGPLELAGGRGEAVEDEVLAHTVDPLAPEVSQ